MGQGLLTGQETKRIQKIDAQSVQSAYENGLLSDAKEVDTTNAKAVVNRPHIVNNTSKNTPNDLSWGIREVFYYGTGQFIIQITGIDTDGEQNRWNCIGNTDGDTLTIGIWTSEKYTHPTTSGNKHIPSGGMSGQILEWAADGVAIWKNDFGAITGIKITDSGNTVTVEYSDGSKEVLSVIDQDDYKVEEYNSSGELIKATTTTTDIDGNISIERK